MSAIARERMTIITFASRCCAIAALTLTALAGASAPAGSLQLTPEEREYYEFLRDNSNDYFRKQLQGPPDVVDGQTLHPKFQYHIEKYGRSQKPRPLAELVATPQQLADYRLSVDRVWSNRSSPTQEMAKVEDRTIPGPAGAIPIRIYWPRVDRKRDEALPVLVYFHGGGWLVGSVAAVDPAVRLIANEADVIAVSVDYRLAPANKFPAAQDDALAAFRWVRDHAEELGGDPRRVGIGGDSAGGQMSIVTSLRTAKTGERGPAYQLLYYPVVDMSSKDYRSMRLFREGFGLNEDAMDYFRTAYFTNEQQVLSPDASPILASTLSGMAPAIIATAGFDILRDHGKTFAERMRKEGIAVHYVNYGSLIHGFMQHSMAIDEARAACIDSARLFGQAIRSVR